MNRTTVILLTALFALTLVSCGSPSSTSSSASSESAAVTSNAATVTSALPRVKSNVTDFKAAVTACDSSGITLRLTNPDSNYKCIVFLNYAEVGDTKYSVLDGQAHVTQYGRDVTASLELTESASATAKISADGVSDYSDIKLNFDNTTYNDSHNYTMKSLDIVIG